MKMIKVCKGIEISNKILTKTWIELEKFFGVSISKIGTVYEKKTQDIKGQINLLLILVCQDNNLTREEMLNAIDIDPDKNMSIFTALANASKIFPEPEGLTEETEEPGK